MGAAVVGLAALTLLPGLGSASRLSYHEAIVAQAAREVLASGSFLVPTLDGRPWLEKPPLPIWLVAGLGRCMGLIDEWVARAPSAVAATALALAVALLARRHLGDRVGLLAGLVQATTFWSVGRGRLAEADVLLTALLAWLVLAFDGLRSAQSQAGARTRPLWSFAILGALGLVKGIGFGAALAVAIVVPLLFWDRDWGAAGRLARCWWGWALALAITLSWPLVVLARHPEAWGLWVEHIAGRFAGRRGDFAGEPWWEYLTTPLMFLLPWTPLAVAGAWRSWRRTQSERGGLDRLLWAWAVGPVLLVSLAQARNSHYVQPALAPWSIWTALSLVRLSERLAARGWTPRHRHWLAGAVFAGLGLALGIGFATLGSQSNWRGPEWAFYVKAGRLVPADESLILLYDDWDRRPYATPFGPMPYDLAARLFYLNRPATWRASPDALIQDPPEVSRPFAVLARGRDLPQLDHLGRVQMLAQGPQLREPASKVDDRAFVLVRVVPEFAPERAILADFLIGKVASGR
jgi:4-amino-4-deoxy-L-arabinose transferase-like glycosyltransferase